MMAVERDIQKPAQQIERLIQELEAMADPNLRAKVVELIQSLMDFHAAGLERLMEIIAGSREAGHAISDQCARDGLVGSLLLLYGLHPLDFETRVRQSIDKLRPYLNSSGASVELLDTSDGVVRLRLGQSNHSCASSELRLRTTVEEALYEAAPDLTAIQVEGTGGRELPRGFVPLSSLRTRNG